jgi:hypothetical protein
MTMTAQLSYQVFLGLRRQVEIEMGVGSPVFYSSVTDGYKVWFNHDSTDIVTIAEGADATDFETYRQPYCNKINWATPDQVNSHNFCDDTDWIEAPSSLYMFAPTAGKRARLKQINGILDAGIDLSDTKYLQMTSWFSIDGTTPCPTFVPGTPTPFGTPAFNPGGGVYTGWISQQYDAKQDYTTWIHLTSGVPDYGLRHYVWNSPTELKLRAQNYVVTATAFNLFYSFFGTNDFFELRSSLNERLETWIEGDVALDSPNSVGAFFAVYFSLYDEW